MGVLDLEQLKIEYDELAQEAAEAVAAKAALDQATEAANTARNVETSAMEAYVIETEERNAKIMAIISRLQAALQDAQ